MRLTLLTLTVICLTGCGPPPTRFDLCGTVTYKGKPVPAGLVVINPDLSQGNDGPQGMAEIKDGKYDTSLLAKGAPSGAVILMIDGFEGGGSADAPQGKALFIGYKLSLALPRA